MYYVYMYTNTCMQTLGQSWACSIVYYDAANMFAYPSSIYFLLESHTTLAQLSPLREFKEKVIDFWKEKKWKENKKGGRVGRKKELISHLVFKCHWRSMSFQQAACSDPCHVILRKREIEITNSFLFVKVWTLYHRLDITSTDMDRHLE